MSLPVPTRTTLETELDRIARKQIAARSVMMRGVEAVGRLTEGAATTILGMSPISLEKILESAFRQLYDLSGKTDQISVVRDAPRIANRAAAIASGAAGGWFGIAGIVPDLIASTTVIFNSIQKVAREHGFDTTDPEVRLECLAVFQFGEPGEGGDAAAKSFIANRLLTNGQTVSALISRFAAEFATRLTTKLGAQAVPIIGAATGAAINYAFADYYERVADVHFSLLRLAKDHPEADIEAAYRDALTRAKDQPKVSFADRLRKRTGHEPRVEKP